MSKSTTRPKKQPSEEPQPSGPSLDTKIADATIKAAGWAQTYWKWVATIVGAVVLGILLSQVFVWWSESRETALQERLWALTGSADARNDDPEPELAGLKELVSEARGAESEPIVLRAAVSYLLDQANRLETSPTPALGEESGKTDAEREALRKRILATVSEISSEAKERFASDAAMVAWATEVEDAVRAETDRSWLPAPHSFGPQSPENAGSPPGDGAEASSQASEDSGVESAPARETGGDSASAASGAAESAPETGAQGSEEEPAASSESAAPTGPSEASAANPATSSGSE